MDKRHIGQLGEDIYEKQIVKRGYNIALRNYRKPWGEIDIIAEKDDVLHFIEVKTVGHPFYETGDEYVPEDNIHPWKLKRLSRAIQTYLMEKDIDDDKVWQVDVAAVFLDFEQKTAKIRVTFDIGL
ncbi:MAG: YraN family protein [Candidatus Niyogibacteria bacterium]|nr:YraN family protein [Candidatus Niyogibacteria bacterium]